MNLGGLNLGDLMKQAQQAQEQMQHVQSELKHRTVTADAGAGMVTAVVTGTQELLSITIDPSIIKPDEAQMLQDLVLAAVNKALQESREMAESELKKLTSFLPKIPGLPF